MRTDIIIAVSAEEGHGLPAVLGDRNYPQNDRQARIVLLTADGIGANGIIRATGKSKTCV